LIFNRKLLSPQEIRDKILDPASSFQSQLISFLESVRIGEFLTGSHAYVKETVALQSKSNINYISPERTLPTPPPPYCDCGITDCHKCSTFQHWFEEFKCTVDDLLLKSNVHDCFRGISPDGSKCKARFPRECFQQTSVDPDNGHIDLKKLEEWLNDISPGLTYLVRGNTDVTSILSGTAIKSAVIYIADYITKTGLKTHVVFDSIKTIFDK
ncbi:hypothetical protein F5876DRAFT_8779, partial [Lentinula aff. lateritia]